MEFVDYKCLESLIIEGEEMIATEGIGDKIKSAAKFIGRGLMEVLRAIRRVLGIIASKLKALISRKRESPKEAAARLTKENEELKARISTLERNYGGEKFQNETMKDKKDKATKMIASLKMEIADNEKKLKSVENARRNENKYSEFQKTALAFISLISQQCNKAYTLLPNIIEKAKKYENKSKNDIDEDFYDDELDTIPNKFSGNWQRLYADLRGYIYDIKESSQYIYATPEIYNGFSMLVKESNKTIEYLENMVNNMNKNGTENNFAYKKIISAIMSDRGFINMLQKSVNTANEIINIYVNSGFSYYEDERFLGNK